MQEIWQNLTTQVLAVVYSLAMQSAAYFLLLVLTIVALFFAWIWMRMHPQPYFLHLIVFNFGLLVFSSLYFLPTGWLYSIADYFRTVPTGRIVLLAVLLAWLSFAAIRYGKPQREISFGAVWRSRLGWIALSLVAIAAGLAADTFGWIPTFPNQSLIIWLTLNVINIAIALVFVRKNFTAAKTEAAVFLFAYAILLLAAYLDIFIDKRLAILPLVAGVAMLVWLILLYHRRFLALEAELRAGLYDENLLLREENIVQSDILALTREAVLQIDRDEVITYANPAFARLTDRELRTIRGKKMREVVNAGFYEAAQPALKEARRGHDGVFEIMLHRRDKSDVLLHVQTLPLFDSRQKLRGVHLGFFDLTETNRLRQDLQTRLTTLESDVGLFRGSLEKMAEAVVLTDAERKILFVNQAFTRLAGYHTTDLEGKTTAIYRTDAAAEKKALQPLQQGNSWSGVFENRRKDGSRFQADVYAVPHVDSTGQLRHILWMERDAAPRLHQQATLEQLQRKLAEQNIQYAALEAQSTEILSSLETGVILVRTDGACRSLNEASSRLLGYAADQISLAILPAFVRDVLRLETSYGGKMRTEATEFTDSFKRPDGVVRQLRWRALPLAAQNGDKHGVILQIIDVTEAVALQKQVAALEDKIGQAQEHFSDDAGLQVAQLRQILTVSESMQSQADFAVVLQNLLEAAAALGWPRLAIFQNDEHTHSYDQIGACGFPVRVTKALKSLAQEEIDQYFQERFAVGAGFFLRQNQDADPRRFGASPIEAEWRFLPANLGLPVSGAWQPRDVLLLPLQARGKTVGLFVCGEPASGVLPQPAQIQPLEKLALQAAFAIEQEQRRSRTSRDQRRNQLLVDIGKMVNLDAAAEKEIQEIVALAKPVLGGEVCLLIFGPPAFGAHTRAAAKGAELVNPEKWGKVQGLAPAAARALLTQIEPLLPETGAETRALQPKQTALPAAMDLDTGRGPLDLLIARLNMRGKRLGALCCVRPAAGFTSDEVAFVAELADRIGLIMENARLFAEIDSKAQELEQANSLISEFLANVSHELRTPLHTILSYVELLRQQKDLSRDDRIRHLQTIQNSGNRLLNLINDLLDLSKIEAGRVELLPEAFEVRELLREIESDIGPLCAKAGLQMHLHVADQVPPYLEADREKLARVLLNLARNAQKFTTAGAVEIFAAMRDPNTLRLQVRDSGIGIPTEHLRDIFEPFHQIDRKASRRYEGSGLGLAISKKLVTLMGGQISVKSKVGAGTVFTVEIPVKAGKSKPPRPEARKVAAEKGARKKKIPGTARQILLVDDDESTREAMRFLLENAGYQVSFASDGPAAISAAQHLRPDVILLDIMMPGMDGYQVARTLKAQKQLRDIPVIALTARAMYEDRQQAKDAGCDDFLTKPFAMDEFFAMVARYTNGGE